MGAQADLARRLEFAKHFVLTGEASASARAVGVSEGSASVMANKWLKRADVQDEIKRLRGAALARVEMRNQGAIADLVECLETLTKVQRVNLADFMGDHGEIDIEKLRKAPAGVLKKLKIRSTTDEKGQVFAEHEVAVESAVTAAQAMIRHYDGLDQPSGPQVNIGAIMLNLPAETAKQLGRALLAQGAIDTTAKVIE